MPDFNNLYDVINYAIKLGKGQTVFFRAGGKQLSITHTERRDLWDRPDCIVFFQTI